MESQDNLLVERVARGYYSLAKESLEKGAHVNARNKYGETVLILATCQLDDDIIKLLLEWGADVNLQDDDGYTALMHAAAYGEIELCNLLVRKYGADISITNSYGKTALDHAKQANYGDIITYLEKIKARDNTSYNPIDIFI